MENTPDVLSIIIVLFTKIKIYLYAIFVAFLSGAVKYTQQIRNGLRPTFFEYVQFSIVASAITLTTLALLNHLGMEVDFVGYTLMFWAGVSADYLYLFIQKTIEKLSKKWLEK